MKFSSNASSSQLPTELNEHQLEELCSQPINPDELKGVLDFIENTRIPIKYHQQLIRGIIDSLLAASNINNLDLNLEYLKHDKFSKEYAKQCYQELLTGFLEETETTLSADGLTVDTYIHIKDAWLKITRAWERLKHLFRLEQTDLSSVYDLQAHILKTLDHKGHLDITASLEVFHPRESDNENEDNRDTEKCRTLVVCLRRNILSLPILSFLKQEPSLKEETLKIIISMITNDYVSPEWQNFLSCAAKTSPPELLKTILESLPKDQKLRVLKIKIEDTSETILETFINHHKDDAIFLLEWLPPEQRLEAITFKPDYNPTILEQLIPSPDFSYRIVAILELLPPEQRLKVLTSRHTIHPTVLAACIETLPGYQIVLMLELLPEEQRLTALTFQRDHHPTILETCISSHQGHQTALAMLKRLPEENQLKALTQENSAHKTILDQLDNNPTLLPAVYFALTPHNRLAMLDNRNISKTVLRIMAANPPIQTAILNNTTGLEKSRLVIFLAIEKYIQFRNTSSPNYGFMSFFSPIPGDTEFSSAKTLKDKIIHAKDREALNEHVKEFLNEFFKNRDQFSVSSWYPYKSCTSFLLAEFKNDPLLEEKFLSDTNLQFSEESESTKTSTSRLTL